MNEKSDFIALGVVKELSDRLQEKGISVPTEVQVRAIPEVLAGSNVIIQSPTGTGKTLTYVLPVLQRGNPSGKELECLIMVPSRELAVQVSNLLKELAGQLKTALAIGGTNMSRQLESLKEKPKILVGTPGRMAELLQMGKLNGQTIRTVVVDEADKMLSQGYLEDVYAVLKGTLRTRQVLFLSATIPREIVNKAGSLMTSPLFINLNEAGRTPPTIKHLYFMCEAKQRLSVLTNLCRIYRPQRALVFVQRNEGTVPLARSLEQQGLLAGALHSDLSQPLRKKTLQEFREGQLNLLVTTDLLARGLDIEGIDYVFNYDLPQDEEFYLHRVGRTGRAGKEGTAITLVDEQRKFVLGKFARYLKIEFVLMGLDGNTVFPVKFRKKGANDEKGGKQVGNKGI